MVSLDQPLKNEVLQFLTSMTRNPGHPACGNDGGKC